MSLENIQNMSHLLVDQLMDAAELKVKLPGINPLLIDQTALIAPMEGESSSMLPLVAAWLVVLTILVIGIAVVTLTKRSRRTKKEYVKPEVVQTESTTATPIMMTPAAGHLSFPSIRQWREVKDQIEQSILPSTLKERYLEALTGFDGRKFEEVRSMSDKSITQSDVRYMICFSVGMCVTDIATIYDVEPGSIYTMRYRLRKKFPQEVLPHISFL